MYRFAPAVLALTLVFAAPVLSRAQDDGGDQAPPPEQGAPAQTPRRGPGMEKLQQRLGLDDAGFAKLEKAMDDHRAAMEPLQKKGRELARDLGEQLKSKASDGDIQKTLDGLDQNRKDIQAANDRFQKELSFLTPTQRAKLLLGAMMRQRHGWGMHPGMGQGGGRGPRNGPAAGGGQPPSGGEQPPQQPAGGEGGGQ